MKHKICTYVLQKSKMKYNDTNQPVKAVIHRKQNAGFGKS